MSKLFVPIQPTKPLAYKDFCLVSDYTPVKFDCDYGDTVFIVYILVENEHGEEWSPKELFHSEESAERCKSSILDDSYIGYKEWDGYFEELVEVLVHKVVVANHEYN